MLVHKGLLAGMVVALAMVAGCASVGARTGNDDLASLQLFSAHGQPRFTVELDCIAGSERESVQCFTVRNAFYMWANQRHITVRPSKGTAPVFGHAGDAQLPYLLVVSVQPRIVASFRQSDFYKGQANTMHAPGSVGYKARIQAYSTADKSKLRELSVLDRNVQADGANVTPAMLTEVNKLIARIDPEYSP